MVAGEFAVLEPNQELVVMAVNRFVYSEVKKSPVNKLHLVNFNMYNLHFSHHQNKLFMKKRNNGTRFVEAALELTYTYLYEKGINLSPIEISVRSELDDKSGKKYGLGSSAAVVTSVVEAILTYFLPIKPAPLIIFKLAALAHVKTQGNGSGADVAASTYGGLILYKSFQADWLLNKYAEASNLRSLIDSMWDYLSIRQLKEQDHLYLAVGWTGSPASTKNLVNEIQKLKQTDEAKYWHFIEESQSAVSGFVKGIETANHQLIYTNVSKNRRALAELGRNAKVDIETDALNRLSQLAEQNEGAAKLSGAGGGDCGIAFFTERLKVPKVKQAWKNEGITPLNLDVYYKKS